MDFASINLSTLELIVAYLFRLKDLFFLLYWLDLLVHSQLMHHDSGIDVTNVMMRPGEFGLVCPQKLDQSGPKRLAQELSNFENLPEFIRAKLNLI